MRDNRTITAEQLMMQAFTLVELAIVLVIIGLIVGGVLAGQALIRASEIRATINQLSSYNAAANTFRVTYGGIPGDTKNAEKFFPASDYPNVRNGDGNKILEPCKVAAADGLCDLGQVPVMFAIIQNAGAPENPGSNNYWHEGETLQFWHHLSVAGLIGGSFNGCSEGGSADPDCGQVDFSYPRSKVDNNGIGVFGMRGKNYYQLGIITTDAEFRVQPSLLTEGAYNIDAKMDDGRPGSGMVQARGALPDGSSRINFTLKDTDADFIGGNVDACINEPASGAVLDATELRTATYALGNTRPACSIRVLIP